METLEFRCHPGVGPEVSGEALVTDDNFSARYDLDRIEANHEAYAENGVVAAASAVRRAVRASPAAVS